MCVFLHVGRPTWTPQTLGSAWSARNWLGGKDKGIRQKLPLLSKTRDLLITKRGKNGSKFKFELECLNKGTNGNTMKRRKRRKFGRMHLDFMEALFTHFPPSFPKYPSLSYDIPSWPLPHLHTPSPFSC